MELEIMFDGKNMSRVHNWDLVRAKMQERSDKNVFEALKLSRSL
jgi:hypothetical protein